MHYWESPGERGPETWWSWTSRKLKPWTGQRGVLTFAERPRQDFVILTISQEEETGAEDWELYSNSSLVVVFWCRHEPLPCRSRVWGREALGARQRGLSATPEIEQAWSSSQLWLDTYLLSDQIRVVRSLSTLVSNRLTPSPTAV